MKNLTLFNLNKHNNSARCCGSLFLLLFLGFFSQVSAQGSLVPACNLIGPLEACAVADPNDTSGDMVINVEVARSGTPNLLNATTNLNFTYSFSSNSTGAFIRSYGNVIYNSTLNKTTQTLIVFPGTTTPEFNLQLNVVNTTSSPNTICECSKSVSVSKVAATASHTPIACAGGTSTLTVTGAFSDIGVYSYTLLPSGPTNSDGVFGALPGSESGITYTVAVQSAEECITTVSETITAPAANPILLNCPPETTALACLTQDAITSAFNAWLASFSFSGGTNSVAVRSPLNPTAPSRCGGGTQVTWTVTDDCGQTNSCTRTFAVAVPPGISFNCPTNTTTTACQTQSQVDAAYAAWLGSASGSGGCGGSLTNDSTGAPPACGGSKTVTFTYSTSCALPSTCQATFTVAAPSLPSLTCPTNATTNACQTQTAVNNAYAIWLATAAGSGGCNGQLSNNSTGAPPACGGSKTVTFTYTSSCAQPATCQATFTVPVSPTVTLTCPANKTTTACQTQAAVNAAYATWLATATASGGCNGALTNNSTGAPPACGGSKTVTFTYTSTCAPLSTTCQATFTVPAGPAVVLTCPINKSVAGDLTQAAISAAYSAWLATATASGGCGGVLTNNSSGPPTACGTSKTVTFSYSNSCGQPITCQATFSINACNVCHIYPTQTTCCNYVTGTASCLQNVCTKLNCRTVNNAIPGVFFYYASIVAPSSSFTINVKQTNDGDLNKLFSIQNAANIRLTNASCGNVGCTNTMISNDKEAKIVVNGATTGATYIISVKYDVKSIIGAVYTGPDDKSTYTFKAYVNNVLQPATVGTIDAVAGCVDNTPVPGSCSLPTSKQSDVDGIKATVYPNPFDNSFKINFTTISQEDVQIKVFDMLGKLVESSIIKVSDIDNFELGSKYASGIYNVIITQGTEVKTQRVIKK